MNEEWVEEVAKKAYEFQSKTARAIIHRLDPSYEFPPWEALREEHKQAWQGTVRVTVESYMEHHLALVGPPENGYISEPELPDQPRYVCNEHGHASNFTPCERYHRPY